MDTFLSESDETLKQEFERFAQEKLAPIASALANRKHNLMGFLKQMAAAGYLGLNAPVEYGGKNSSFLQVVLLAQALAQYDSGVVLSLAYHTACIELIKLYGSEEQKKLYLSKLASGEILGIIAHLQHDNKVLAVLSELPSSNSLVLVFAMGTPELSTNAASNGRINLAPTKTNTDDFSLIDNLAAAKITVEERPVVMGLRSVYFVDLVGVAVGAKLASPRVDAIDPYDKSRSMFARDIIKTMLAAAAVGMSQSVLNQSVAYAKTGQRDGQPLSQSEAIQWKLADLFVENNAARLLTYRAAWSKDNDDAHFSQYAAMCKSYATRVARFHSGESLQVILPLLNDAESALPRFYLDSKMLETFEATNEQEKVLLSDLLGIK